MKIYKATAIASSSHLIYQLFIFDRSSHFEQLTDVLMTATNVVVNETNVVINEKDEKTQFE